MFMAILARLDYGLSKLNEQANTPHNGLNIQQHVPQKSTQKRSQVLVFGRELSLTIAG